MDNIDANHSARLSIDLANNMRRTKSRVSFQNSGFVDSMVRYKINIIRQMADSDFI